MADQRMYQRKKSSIPATFTLNGQTWQGAVLDVSKGGAFVQIEHEVAVGEAVEMNLGYLTVGEPFCVNGKVVSRRADGFGVRFTDLSQTQENLLGFLYW